VRYTGKVRLGSYNGAFFFFFFFFTRGGAGGQGHLQLRRASWLLT
jgi:hypothetical protein